MNFGLKNIDKSNWKTYRFDEITQSVSERIDPNKTDLEVYVGLEHLDSETIKISRHGTPADVNGQKLKFYKGDVIFGRRRAYQRKAGLAEVDGICSAHALVLRANADILLPELLPFFLHSDEFMNRAVDISVGSLSPTINWKTLRKEEFLIPPINKQPKFFELFAKSDDLKNRQSNLKHQLICLRKSIISELGQMDLNFKKLKTAGIKIIDGDRGKNYPKNHDYLPSGHCLFLNAGNVTPSGFKFKTTQFISEEKDLALRNGRLANDDLVLTTRGTVGNCAFYNDEVPFDTVRINSGMVILRNDNSFISTRLLYQLFVAGFFDKQIQRFSYGSAQPQLSVSVIEKLKIPELENSEKTQHQLREFRKNIQSIDQSILTIKDLTNTLTKSVFS